MEQVMGGRCAEKSIWGEEETPELVGGDEALRWSTGDEERSGASEWDDDVQRVLSICFCPFATLFPLVSTEELRVDELPVDELSVCT
jgi:hypothetical protein